MRIYEIGVTIWRRFQRSREIYTVESEVNPSIIYALADDEVAIANCRVAVRCDIDTAEKELREAHFRTELLEELCEVIRDYKEIRRFYLREVESDR